MFIDQGFNPEIQKSVEQSKRMEKSADLIRNPIKEGEIGDDKVYIQADKILNEGNKWTVNINSKDSTVILDDEWRQNLGLNNSAIVPDIRNGNGEKKLVSGGSWVWIENNQGQRFLALMRRDGKAPTDANCLTGPAGRCGEKLSRTSVNETNQELIFLQIRNGDETKLLVFYKNEEDKKEALAQKMRQVGEVYLSLMNKFNKTGEEKYKTDAEYLVKNVKDEKDVEFLKMDEVEDKEQELDEITMTIDGVPVDMVKGIAYMDEKSKTLEVREIINVKLPKGVDLAKVMDGEVYSRDATLVAEGELRSLLEDDLVPALRNYIEKVV